MVVHGPLAGHQGTVFPEHHKARIVFSIYINAEDLELLN
jgi:hypothetical protein